ncbi:HAMP domain-containing histidine kinase [Gracilibacillus oryzae]|uniref:histidine kinase n=1 Tax=Gracilibacillus oryzae TaxID=1672701 RepID=A0A7C8GUS3_9BACI|nr:HAMP domain-containing sensor histidine kinase [Gracilibacillus oryzae]KAB8137720.1 HAMP domain-containing histidine kinase [Gracilibacillus oryzae]
MKKLFQSLLAKYMLIIILAISLVQIVYLILAIFIFGLSQGIDRPYTSDEADYDVIEEQWHKSAAQLEEVSVPEVQQLFEEWQEKYEDASMFWVNQDGDLMTQSDADREIPNEWTAFTVIAYPGNNDSNGFIVFEISRELFKTPVQIAYDRFGIILLIGTIVFIFLFIFLSFLFFRGIRKRLLQLQEAMEMRDVDGLPIHVEVKKQDEIGRLQHSFNRMVEELKESRLREQEEEQLRKELIANLSHDLRTPLTKLNAHTYEFAKTELPSAAKQSLTVMEKSIEDIDKLIENLMSYTLLMASKYKLDLQEIDVIRHTRESLATWYPVFEKEGFEIEVDLSGFKQSKWLVDPLWYGRILDNLLQNVLRHAASGKYVAVKTESTAQYDAILIMDKGKGMQGISDQKGSGIGLSIVDMMVKGMNLEWRIHSTDRGTVITLLRLKQKAGTDL